jgi:hypothetical protein
MASAPVGGGRWLAIIEDAPLFHVDDAIGMRLEARIVGHDHDGGAACERPRAAGG